jgi:hypothetical protein
MLCGFTKVHVVAGGSTTATVQVQVSDLARWDPMMASSNLHGDPVQGAYIVDGGAHIMHGALSLPLSLSLSLPLSVCVCVPLSIS